MKIKVCIAQINYQYGDLRKHLKRIKDIIRQNRRADLIVFPELLLHGHPSLEIPEGLLYRRMKHFYRAIADDSYNIYTFVRDLDARVIIGELRGGPGRFYNAATYIDRETTESYVKTHVHWTENFTPGGRLKVFNSRFGKVGVNICYDAAFPEVWRVLALRGAKLIVNISAVPATFPVDYMWLRMRSAALNNQVYVVYANRPGDYFSGHSGIFNPMGTPVATVSQKEDILKAEIDLDEVGQWREDEQIYQYRRPQLYREIVKSVKKQPDRCIINPNRRRKK